MGSPDGRYSEHVVAQTRRTLTGVFEGGLTVGPLARVTVRGTVTGPVRIQHEGILTVIGMFGGDVEQNEGMLIVSGLSTVLPVNRDDVGAYALGVGSLTTTKPFPLLLQADGTEFQLSQNVDDLNVDAGARYCAWIPNEQRFAPLESEGGPAPSTADA